MPEPARFRLKAKHYLLTLPRAEWEQKETDQATGKQGRKVYLVPRYLDPEDPSDCNYPGEIIVAAAESKQYPRDIILDCKPSIDMEPLNEEAEALLKKMNFIGMSDGEIFGDRLVRDFESQMLQKDARKDGEISELRDQVAELTKLVKSLAAPKPDRRVA